jgi:ketosteroid isomerase-like protein
MGEVVVTRVEASGPPRQTRNLEERVMVRFPGAHRALAALGQRLLSPRSRMRRAWLRRAVVSGWAAYSRADLELMLVRYAPDAELEFDPGQQTLGLSGTFRGHREITAAIGRLDEVWDERELEPYYVLDLGDRVVALGVFRVRGRGSGLRLEQPFVQQVTVREGLVARDAARYMEWEDGLQAAGLDPDAFNLPRPRAARKQPVAP